VDLLYRLSVRRSHWSVDISLVPHPSIFIASLTSSGKDKKRSRSSALFKRDALASRVSVVSQCNLVSG